jgi:hypothetical protein
MDVLRRHRLLVSAGLAASLALAILSYIHVSPDGVTYRNPQIWSSSSTLILSQPGFPEWRSQLQSVSPTDRLAGLADVYAAFATSDAVGRELRRRGFGDVFADDGEAGKVTAAAVPSSINSTATPLVQVSASGETPAAATRLTRAATSTFIDVVTERQRAAEIPPSERITLRVVKQSGEPELIVPRSKTPFIIILLGGLTLTIAAAFIRDNAQRPPREGSAVETTALEARPRPLEPAIPPAADVPRTAPDQTRATGQTENASQDVRGVRGRRFG